MSHHPSCRPNDKDLIFKCHQCGNEDLAEDVMHRLELAEKVVTVVREAWENQGWENDNYIEPIERALVAYDEARKEK